MTHQSSFDDDGLSSVRTTTNICLCGGEEEENQDVSISTRGEKTSTTLPSGFLANIVDKIKEVKMKIDEVPIFGEFLEVFPEDYPGLLLDKKIEFEIEIMPRTSSISKAPYRVAPAELQELHNQL